MSPTSQFLPRLIVIAVVVPLVMACEPAPPGPTPAQELPVSDLDQFVQTVVVRDPAGLRTVSTRSITVGDERRQNAARAARAAATAVRTEVDLDPDCPYSLWLYDRTDLTGNRLCIIGGGGSEILDLASVARLWRRRANGVPYVAARWNIAVGSYWPGESGGLITAAWVGIDAGVGESYPGQALAFPAWGPPGTFANPAAFAYEEVRLD